MLSVVSLVGSRKLKTQTLLRLILTRSLALLLISVVVQTRAESVADVDSIVYAQDIKAAMHRHIDNVVGDDGLFNIVDDVTNEALILRFVQIHDPVRQIGDDVYFACTDFHVDGIKDKLYDVDFWLREEKGELIVFQTKIHKEPRNSLLYGWYKHPRYTFVNDAIEYLYSN